MKRVGIDIGGTFTDVVIYDEASHSFERRKTTSIPSMPEEGCLEAFVDAGLSADAVNHLIHGTTLVTNLIIERKGAKAGLITTKGFSDVLQLMRATRERPYDLHWRQAEPLIPRHLRLEATERIDARGMIITPLDEASVRDAVAQLLAADVEAVAIVFIHSYANPAHEYRARAIVKEIAPNLPVSISVEACREIREYERTSTTALNAYVMPRLDDYVGRLEDTLPVQHKIKYMNSEGGVIGPQDVRRLPIKLCLSGPAGGVLASLYLTSGMGLKNIITVDMGGTSLDICVIRDGVPQLTNTVEVQWGVPIRGAAIDVKSIGAGGGSIVWIDEGGAVRVGPQSAGAMPGPACYGRGGTDCTVTDANLILGILNPGFLLGGRLKVYRDRAQAAIQPIADYIGASDVDTAEGIYRIVNANMAAAIRKLTVEKGIDPREFTLLAFGGAGGQHAVALAREIGISQLLIPMLPSVFSAFGMVTASQRQSYARTVMKPLDDASLAAAVRQCEELERDAIKALRADSAITDTEVVRSADVRYERQAHELSIELLDGDTANDVYTRFEARHLALFGTTLSHPATIVTVRSSVIGALPKIALEPQSLRKNRRLKPIGERRVHPHKRAIPVFDRVGLDAGATLPTPCLIEEVDSIHYVPPGYRAEVDEWLNIRVTEDY